VAAPGRYRDWLNVLHPPYTLWHLSYVAVGAGLAPRIDASRLVATLLAFALAVGVAAHALDELAGRPLRTSIPARQLVAAAGLSLAGAAALGIAGIGRVGWPLVGFIACGVVLVVAYNLELLGGRLHNSAVFALAWGAFPLLTAYYAQTGTVRPAAVVGAAFAFGLSTVQRVLSTESRHLRREVEAVEGVKLMKDGSRTPVDQVDLLGPIDRALRMLSWAAVALGVALILAHVH
jgi:asparagine N-glycosylation enzyme membrane subunit Stt3